MKVKNITESNIKENMFHFTTEMGLNVFYIPKEDYNKQYAIFATKYGSIDTMFVPHKEREPLSVPDGIAHFLEHKLFEEPGENIFDTFSKLGANVNAYTSFDKTAYLFSTTNNFYESLETLIRFVQNPHFTSENVEKEKGIIEQEIKMYDDEPGWNVFFNALNALYKNHTIKIDIAGTVDSIQKIDEDLLYRTYNTFYHPENMVLFIVGDLSLNKIKELVNRTERKDYEKLGEIKRIYPLEPKGINKKEIIAEMSTATPMMYIGYKDEGLGEEGAALIKSDLITNILLDMLFGSSSKFYNELYEEGLISPGFGAYYSGGQNYGHSFIVGESENPKAVFYRVQKFIKDEALKSLNMENFNRIKNNQIGSFIMGFDSVESIANLGLDLYFSGFSLFDYLDLLKSIRYEDVVHRFKNHLLTNEPILSLVNPKRR